jgi:hypothetical protein
VDEQFLVRYRNIGGFQPGEGLLADLVQGMSIPANGLLFLGGGEQASQRRHTA